MSQIVNMLRGVMLVMLLLIPLVVVAGVKVRAEANNPDQSEILYTTTGETKEEETGQTVIEANAAGSQFSVSASEFTVDFVVLEPTILEYKLTNRLSEQLNFRLQLSDPNQASQLSTHGLKLEIETAGKRVELVEGLDITVAGRNEQLVKIILTPLKRQDYSLKLDLKLIQQESARKLSEPEYELAIAVNSKLASSSELNLTETGAVIFIALGVIILSVLIINRNSNNGPQSN